MLRVAVYFILTLLLIPVNVTAKLVGYWDFEGNLQDSAGNGGKSEIYGKVGYTWGISGECLDLSGSGDNAIILKESRNLINGLGAFTVSFWYKGILQDNPAGASIVSKNGEGDQGWQIWFYNQEGSGCFTVRGLQGAFGDCSGTVPIADGQWHHIAGIFDGQYLCLYIDGILENVQEATGRPGLTDSPIVIGANITEDKAEPYAFSKGMIDELRLYDEAIDESRIKQLSNRDQLLGKTFTKMYHRLGVYPIQLHRGGGVKFPENTLKTFEWAWSQHVIPEADVRMTQEGTIVCFHDTDLKRVCSYLPEEIQKKGIDQMTLSEVKQLDVGRFRDKPGQRVPTLDEVFKAMYGRPERFLYLDYKYIDIDRLARMVKQYGIEQQVIFTSSSHHLIMQWKQRMPLSQTMLWTGGTEGNIARKLESLRRECYQGITILQFHYRTRDAATLLSDNFLLNTQKELTEKGIIFQVLPWKTEDSSVYKKLIDMGIQSFATDYPDSLLPIYRQKFDLAN